MKLLMTPLAITVLFLAVLSTTPPAKADSLRVPSESPSIVNAILNLTYGDTIWVEPGTYDYSGFRDLDFAGKNLNLLSEGGPEITILDGSGSHRVFQAVTNEHISTLIRGFTFRNGQFAETWGIEGMVKIVGADVTFEDMIFENGYTEGSGGAVHVKDSGKAVFNDCVFRNNVADGKGAGVYVESQSIAEFTNCLFEENSALEGAAIFQSRSSVSADHCTFLNNTGGCIFTFWQSSVVVDDSEFSGNSGTMGVVVNLQNSATATLTNCLITDNTATTDWEGGIILAELGSFDLVGCTVANNTCAAPGNGAVDDRHDGSTITNCVIWGTKVGMGTKRCETITCSLIYGNEGGDVSPCVDLGSGGNFNTDPGYCGPSTGDYRIAVNSPCLPAYSGGCGLIGATDNGGCTLVSTDALNFGSLKAMYR